MLLNKVSLGTPSTPIRSALLPTSITPSTPQRVNRFISKLQVAADAFMSTSPRRPNSSRVSTPIRQNASQRVPLRQLYAQSTLSTVLSPKRTRDSDMSEENHRMNKRFDRHSVSMKSIPNMNRRRGNSFERSVAKDASVATKEVSPVPILQGGNMFKILYETEPMDCEMTTTEIEYRQYALNNMNNANDSMEIDIEDEPCCMEVDVIVEMETLMDYIPMH